MLERKRSRLKSKIRSGNFDMCLLQETKLTETPSWLVTSLWGDDNCDQLGDQKVCCRYGRET
jgi:hypothetical protein